MKLCSLDARSEGQSGRPAERVTGKAQGRKSVRSDNELELFHLTVVLPAHLARPSRASLGEQVYAKQVLENA